MILHPKNLEEMVSFLKELPSSKKKVLILVGRHPNEGTLRIARVHHKNWEEKHGAVVFRIPTEWTPHRFWGKVYETNQRPSAVDLHDLLSKIPTDAEIVDHLRKNGLAMPVVTFHGTPTKSAGREESNYAVKYYDRPSATKGKLMRAPSKTAIPDLILVEYFWPGYKSAGDAGFSRVRRNPRQWYVYSNDKSSDDSALGLVASQFSKEYLMKPPMDLESVNHFSTHFNPGFENWLGLLSDDGVPKKRVKIDVCRIKASARAHRTVLSWFGRTNVIEPAVDLSSDAK